MSDLIDDLNIVVRVLIEDGYPSKYADSVQQAITRISELERSSNYEDVDCYCE